MCKNALHISTATLLHIKTMGSTLDPRLIPRSESDISHNYSLLEYYGTEVPLDESPYVKVDLNLSELIVQVGAKDKNDTKNDTKSDTKDTENDTENDTTINPTENDNSPCQIWTDPVKNVTPKAIEAVLESNLDPYGFKKDSTFFDSSKDSYNEWFSEYSHQLINQKKKWHILLKSSGLARDGAVPTRFPPKSDKVKKLIRKGIPPEWRGNAWFFYAGGYERLNKHVGIYEKIAKDTAGIHNKDTEVIDRDLNRTFPDNVLFNSAMSQPSQELTETEMIRSLRRVLVAFAHYQPQIGYCQSLNFLAGLLLLFMTEERAFWMLVIMTERIIPKVHSANLEGVHTDQGVLMLCIKEYIPRLWQILGKSFEGHILSEDKILTRLPPVTLVTSSWFMSVFVGVLPIESVLRVWDILWYEGSKTIFRISLTICRLCLDHPLFLAAREARGADGETEQIELFQFMQNYPKTITDPNLLIDSCFKKIGGYGYGFLSQDEINKCREFVSQQRNKLQNKKNAVVSAEMSEQERQALEYTSSASLEDEIHDVYGFNKSIMSGVTWNKHISTKMKRRFTRRPK